MTKEILELFFQAGYDNSTDVSLDMYVINSVLVFQISGEDQTARAVLSGILQIVMDDHGVDVEMADV
jgi:hypothetical protein